MNEFRTWLRFAIFTEALTLACNFLLSIRRSEPLCHHPGGLKLFVFSYTVMRSSPYVQTLKQ
jgi:hypothetical protein